MGARTASATLGRAYETALLVTALGLGIQIVFGAFFLALLDMPLRRDSSGHDVARCRRSNTQGTSSSTGARSAATRACWSWSEPASASSTSAARAGTSRAHSSSAAARSSASSGTRAQRGGARRLRGRARRRRGDDGAPVHARFVRRRSLRRPDRASARARGGSSSAYVRYIRDGGRLVLSTPNVANWSMRVGLLAGRWRYTERGILDRTHRISSRAKTLVETLDAAGYRIVELDYTVPVPVVGTPHGRARCARGRAGPTVTLRVPVRRRRRRPGDLGRHTRQGRRQRPHALPRGDRAPAGRRRGRGRRRRLGLRDGSAERAAGSARVSTRSRRPSSTTAARATSARSSRAATSSSSRARTRTRTTIAGSRTSRRHSRQTGRSPACTAASCRTKTPAARAVLPRLPLRPRAARAATRRRRRAELRGHALLERQLSNPTAVWEKYPFADDIMMSEDQEWSRRVLLAGMSIVYATSTGVPSR